MRLPLDHGTDTIDEMLRDIIEANNAGKGASVTASGGGNSVVTHADGNGGARASGGESVAASGGNDAQASGGRDTLAHEGASTTASGGDATQATGKKTSTYDLLRDPRSIFSGGGANSGVPKSMLSAGKGKKQSSSSSQINSTDPASYAQTKLQGICRTQ